MKFMIQASIPISVIASPEPHLTTTALAKQLEVGDIVFIHIDVLPFRTVASDTLSWTNHVGIVVDTSGAEPLIAESTFPFSKIGLLSCFIRRSKEGRIAVCRLPEALNGEQQHAINAAAEKRMGIFYDSGFNLNSRRQFCSRFVHEVIKDALGISIGKIENLDQLFHSNPHADLRFWRIWYFGKIPWARHTITPASLLKDKSLQNVFNGYSSPL
jgi:hypothetical protein